MAVRRRSGGLTAAERAAIAARAVLAIFGGYGLAAAASAFLALALPLTRAEAVTVGMLLSFGLFAAAACYAFGARSARRAALVIVPPAVTLAAAAWVLSKGVV